MNRLDALFRSIASEPVSTGAPTHIIVGLGNPGKDYENTRHNMGFLAIDRIAEGLGVKLDRYRFQALTAEATLGETRVLLMKPETYMNLSGQAVAAAAHFYKIPPEQIFVLCDDISFPVGKLRFRPKGSAGGHNGLKSIIASLGSDAFPRLKLGVGQKPSPDYDLADFVLSRIPKSEETAAKRVFDTVYEALPLLLSGETEKALTILSR